jgi:hypothetical protein
VHRSSARAALLDHLTCRPGERAARTLDGAARARDRVVCSQFRAVHADHFVAFAQCAEPQALRIPL